MIGDFLVRHFSCTRVTVPYSSTGIFRFSVALVLSGQLENVESARKRVGQQAVFRTIGRIGPSLSDRSGFTHLAVVGLTET
jgi:hypothetical protein